MNNKDKETLMKSIIHDDDAKFIETLNNINLVLDESYFDYELLKVALDKERGNIANILISDKDCRVRNPNKINLEETLLHLAMKLKDLSIIFIIINKGASIYDKNLLGDTPLHASYKKRHNNAVDAVLDYIANCDLSFNPDNNDDIVHFHIACIETHTNSVKRFLSLGFDVNSYLSVDLTTFSHLTPLHYVVNMGDFDDLFEILLKHSDLTIKNINGLTPLHSIYYENCLEEKDVDCDDVYYTNSLHEITTKVFKYGNDTKFINIVDSSGLSHFHLCCSTDRPDWVQVFIDSGVDVNSSISLNCSFTAGYTPLHIAVECGSLKIVELLLKNGADCNRSDKQGATPLYLACVNYVNEESLEYVSRVDCEYLKIVKLLLKNGADCNISNNQGVTPLQFVCNDNDSTERAVSILEILLEYSACVVSVDESGDTPIHLMFRRILYQENGIDLEEHFYMLDLLLSKAALTVNLTNKNGLSIFHIICTRNCPNQVNGFLNSGTAIDSCVLSGKFKGYTALHFAVLFNQKSVVEVLLKRNAKVNIKTCKLDTPLHIACEFTELKFFEVDSQYENKCLTIDKAISLDMIQSRRSQLDIIKLLLLYKANVDAENLCENTPLFAAYCVPADFGLKSWFDANYKDKINEINTRIIKITKILLLNNATVTSEQQSIFHLIVSSDVILKISDDLVECLVTAGADINAVEDGLTPLHLAAEKDEFESVQIMLKYKANVNVKCGKSQTPLEKAINTYMRYNASNFEYSEKKKAKYKLYMATIILLLDNGSDVNVSTQSGKTLFYEAILSCSCPFLIENLLYYGADINAKDSLGNSLASFLLDDEGLSCSIDGSYIIFIHVQKLLALGLYVNNKVQKFCNYFRQFYKTVVSETKYNRICNVFSECIDELNRMKNKKMDKYTSLYDILLKSPHELSKNVKNKALRVILEEQDTDLLFPLYSYLLKLQYKKGLLRSDVLKDAKRSLIYVISSNLPDPCYDSILSYLTNEEIVNLKEAAAMKGSFKRKFSNGCSDEVERSTKLQKKSEI